MSDQTLTIVAASVVTSVIVSFFVARLVARRFRRRERTLVDTARRMGEFVSQADRALTETVREVFGAMRAEANIKRAASPLYREAIEDKRASEIRAGMQLKEISKLADAEAARLLAKNKSPRR